MERRLTGLAGLGVAALLLAGTPVAWGQAAPMGTIATGEIVSVDPQNDLLLVKTGLFGNERFKITDQTQISHEGQALRLDELEPGKQVRVEYTEQDGERLASSVEVMEEGAAEPQTGQTP